MWQGASGRRPGRALPRVPLESGTSEPVAGAARRRPRGACCQRHRMAERPNGSPQEDEDRRARAGTGPAVRRVPGRPPIGLRRDGHRLRGRPSGERAPGGAEGARAPPRLAGGEAAIPARRPAGRLGESSQQRLRLRHRRDRRGAGDRHGAGARRDAGRTGFAGRTLAGGRSGRRHPPGDRRPGGRRGPRRIAPRRQGGQLLRGPRGHGQGG